jgi:hypothetical protein
VRTVSSLDQQIPFENRMALTVATLELLRKDRKGSGSRTARSFLDFTIDGDSLYERVAQQLDLISALWLGHPAFEERQKAVGRLLKLTPGDFPGDRVSLYICPECGDLGCGAISVEINFMEDKVIWRDFGYENNYESAVALDQYRSVGPFEFERAAYEAVYQLLK